MKFRKKPIEVEAIKYSGYNELEVVEFTAGQARTLGNDMVIRTLEGDMIARPGDYIICGVAGEFYPCRPDIFEATYDQVKE